MKNLGDKLKAHLKKDGVLATLLYSFKYLYFKFQLLVLFFNLKKRLAKRNYEIKHGLTIAEVRKKTLQFTESLRLPNGPYGRYRYAPGQDGPVLYASLYAALTLHLYNDLADLSTIKRQEWIDYIKSFQSADGWFRDPAIACELAETADWWGWRHLTLHAVMALSCLGAVVDRPFKILESFKDKNFIEAWFKNLHITPYPSPKMNAHLPLIVVTLLQYARDYQGATWADSAIRKIISLLNAQTDPKTGCWCTGGGQKNLINDGVKIAYHFWIFYFYDKLPIKFPERAIDSLLFTQNRFGGFDNSINSSACDDIDSIDPLCRLIGIIDYKKSEIKNSLHQALPWVLINLNQDGGFVFKRNQSFKYGHDKMYSGINESNLFATWFRTLSLAYIGKALPDSWAGRFEWRLEAIPGLQFWQPDNKK